LVFNLLNKIEIIFLILLITAQFKYVAHFNTTYILLGLTILTALAIQTFVLLPILDQRAQLIIDGQTIDRSLHHLQFIGIEVIKFCTLILLFINAFKLLP